ncbi:hypothetical protein HOF40_00095 [Candidatus Parcubacteria bacterium]|jgi:hypothetical protein|nr:hypothetical protein [Candidatus Parcubacteria bacterium]MBT3948471.1 hypothetical protein [Candidatus Parcubacteria bacterium]
MRQKHNLFIFTGIFLLILIGYMGYSLYTNPALAPTEENIAEMDLPEGVSIVERDGERFVRDEGNEVEIKIGDEWGVKYIDDKFISVGPMDSTLDGKDDGFDVGVYTIENNDLNQTEQINNWIENSNCPECYEQPMLVEDNLYKLVDVGSIGEIINYFYFLKDNLYLITVSDSQSDINNIIKNIIFDL